MPKELVIIIIIMVVAFIAFGIYTMKTGGGSGGSNNSIVARLKALEDLLTKVDGSHIKALKLLSTSQNDPAYASFVRETNNNTAGPQTVYVKGNFAAQHIGFGRLTASGSGTTDPSFKNALSTTNSSAPGSYVTDIHGTDHKIETTS